MKRVLTLALLISGLVLAGSLSADMRVSGAQGKGRLWSAPHVRASVVYRIGNTVRIFVPEGNNMLCKGENIPIFREDRAKMAKPTWFTTNFTTPTDLLDKQLVGEVRIFKLVGDNYAYGRLVVGHASAGDTAAKPNSSCFAS